MWMQRNKYVYFAMGFINCRFSILYVCSEDDSDYKNVDKSEEAMKRHIDVVIDFYKRFVEKIRKAIEDYPNYNLIGIMGP